VAAGGLLAYGADRPAVERSAAVFVDRILKGASPAEMPVERPTGNSSPGRVGVMVNSRA